MKNTEKLPNFLIIGAPKCGTTSLYRYLDQHPDIFFSTIKEPQYFAFAGEQLDFKGPGASINDSITDFESYKALFAGVTAEKTIGEASALYLSSPRAPTRIQKCLPDAKLIVILRDPIDRAYSSFMHLRRDGREPIPDFLSAVKSEEKRIRDNWGFLWRYKQIGLYFEQLTRYFDLFDSEQLLILLHEDLREDSAATFKKIFQFLDVDSDFEVDTQTKYNVSGIPKSRWLYDLISKDNAFKRLMQPFIPSAVRHRLVANVRKRLLRRAQMDMSVRAEMLPFFKEDIVKLQGLIDRDLSSWLV